MKKSIFLTLLVFFLFQTATVLGWDLRFGYQRLKPHLGTNQQEYENKDGETLKYKPQFEETVFGDSLFASLVVDGLSYQYERSTLNYKSIIPIENEAVTVTTSVDGTIFEQRLGVMYHLERELAGFYLGGGLSDIEEKLAGGGQTWLFETITPYFQMGIDLILGNFRVRTEQVHLNLGEHVVRINTIGLLFQF